MKRPPWCLFGFNLIALSTVGLLLPNIGLAKARIFNASHSQTCGYILSETKGHDLGEPNPEYNLKAEIDESKSVGMDDVPVLDQRQYGCCWITAEMGYLCRMCESAGAKIRPSDTYLAAISILERAKKAADLRQLISQGGNTPYAISLVSRYGVIPEGALVQTAEGLTPWKPILDFQKGKNGTLLIEKINAKLVTYFSKTNDVLLEAQKIQKANPVTGLADAQNFLNSHPEKLKILSDAKKEYDDAIDNIMNKEIGGLPDSFVYEGKTYTPLQFLKEKTPPDLPSVTMVMPKKIGSQIATLPLPKTIYPGQNPYDVEVQVWNSLTGVKAGQDWSKIDAAIERSLSQNPPRPIRFAIGIKNSLIDMDRGYISIDAFAQYPGFRDEVQMMNAAVPGYTDGGHAILITKIYKNHAGETIGYRIQNSWGVVTSKGDPVGDHGYFIMDVPYMQTFQPSFFFEKGMFEPEAALPTQVGYERSKLAKPRSKSP